MSNFAGGAPICPLSRHQSWFVVPHVGQTLIYAIAGNAFPDAPHPLVTGFSSVGSALLLLAAGLTIDLAVEGQLAKDELTEYGRALPVLVSPILGALALCWQLISRLS